MCLQPWQEARRRRSQEQQVPSGGQDPVKTNADSYVLFPSWATRLIQGPMLSNTRHSRHSDHVYAGPCDRCDSLACRTGGRLVSENAHCGQYRYPFCTKGYVRASPPPVSRLCWVGDACIAEQASAALPCCVLVSCVYFCGVWWCLFGGGVGGVLGARW